MKRLFAAGLLAASALAGTAQAGPLDATGQWSVTSRGSAPLPPMGWNSWNAFNSDIDEEKVLAAAKALVDTGLAAKGYVYVNIDDGWWLKRRTTDGRLIIRGDKFPSTRAKGRDPSFRPLTDRLHAMGFKAGIYSDLGRNSCSQAYSEGPAQLPEGSVAEREVGLYGHSDQDIRLFFTEWGFDAITVDGCGIDAYAAGARRARRSARPTSAVARHSAVTRPRPSLPLAPVRRPTPSPLARPCTLRISSMPAMPIASVINAQPPPEAAHMDRQPTWAAPIAILATAISSSTCRTIMPSSRALLAIQWRTPVEGLIG